MHVSKLEITNFRGVVRGTVSFKSFTALIGPNNCGKTTVVEALALVLGRDRLVRPLTEHDFHGSNPEPASRILIVATLAGFATNDPADHPEWFRHGRGLPKWQCPESGLVRAEQQENDHLSCQIAFAARFDHDMLETVTLRYFFDADDHADPFDEEFPAAPVPTELIKTIGFFLVPASRTWDRMISFGSELFRRVVSYVGGRPAAAVLVERERLRTPAHPLELDGNLAALVGEVDADIRQLFGRDIGLKLRVTTTDSEGILDAIVPHYSVDQATPLPARRHGSGLISLQTLILLMRFGQMRVARGEGFMMVVEEPELHVPPPLQRKLLHLLRSMTTQTIVTTHSPTVAAVPGAHEVMLVVNRNGVLSANPLLNAPLRPDANNVLRNLFLSARDATVTALMHPVVAIPEGKLDASWLRLLVKCCELGLRADHEAQSFAHEVGVVATPDSRILDALIHLQPIAPRVICICDGDQAGRDYVTALTRAGGRPAAIISWPDDWTIENVVIWIIQADENVLRSPDLANAGIPDNTQALTLALRDPRALKNNEIAHSLIADAVALNPACMERVAVLLRMLADVSAGRRPQPGVAQVEDRNGTPVWTFSDAADRV